MTFLWVPASRTDSGWVRMSIGDERRSESNRKRHLVKFLMRTGQTDVNDVVMTFISCRNDSDYSTMSEALLSDEIDGSTFLSSDSSNEDDWMSHSDVSSNNNIRRKVRIPPDNSGTLSGEWKVRRRRNRKRKCEIANIPTLPWESSALFQGNLHSWGVLDLQVSQPIF